MTEAEYLKEYNAIGDAHNKLIAPHQDTYMKHTGYTRGNWGPPIEPFYSEFKQSIQPYVNQLRIDFGVLRKKMGK